MLKEIWSSILVDRVLVVVESVIFADSLMDATIQDSGKEERSDSAITYFFSFSFSVSFLFIFLFLNLELEVSIISHMTVINCHISVTHVIVIVT